MKKFLKYLTIFIVPIILICSTFEIMLRRIPNDYKLKKEFLDQNSDSIVILFLGSSHSFYGINPAEIRPKSFNASQISQSIDYDLAILKKYKNNWRNLKYVVMPISYFSLYSKLNDGQESWRVKNYNIYYKMFSSNKIADYMELFSNKLKINLKRINNYYIKGQSNIFCSNLGWGTGYSSKIKIDIDEAGKISAKRHTKSDNKYVAENLGVLNKIVEFAKNKGIKVLLFTPPAYKSYVDNLDSTQLNTTINAIISIDKEFDNVTYYNFIWDTTFVESDFYDADHLNEIGASKLTKKINSLINCMD